MGSKARIGRNDPCPCGSGEKVKFCCGAQEAREEPGASRSNWTMIGLAVLALVFVVAAASQLGGSGPETTIAPRPVTPPPPARSAPVTSTAGAGLPLDPAANPVRTPQPPGEAPPGKVWSEEHGHWHDVTVNVGPAGAEGSAPAKTPQPPGEPPEGKVWSEEHGHWHDAPSEPAPSADPIPAPAPAPDPTPPSPGDPER